jgi:exodeoxyribonuclease VII large subunit
VARTPFDPSRARGGKSARSSSSPARREQREFGSLLDARRLTVSELSDLIRTTLEQRIDAPLKVLGEVSNLSDRNHWYFSLKDEAAVVSCVAWASSAKKFGFTPKDGDQVLVTGHVSHYGPQGRTQLYVSAMMPIGAGELEQRFRAMCEELREQGYFDPDRKKLLPAFPRKIAVITSATGAAVQDVLDTVRRRCPAVGIVLVDVHVQGDAAAGEVARAIAYVDRRRDDLGVDAILVTRGGGSIEDLWAFNERIVADATLKCSTPIVAAIGHESDTTVIELVADMRAATPTQAAMLLAPSTDEMQRQIEHLHHRLDGIVRRDIDRRRTDIVRARRDLAHLTTMRIAHARAHVERLAQHLQRLRPTRLIAQWSQRLAMLVDRMDRAMHDRLDQRDRLASFRQRLDTAVARRIVADRTRLDARARQLAAVDPRRVLQRGFTYTTADDGSLIQSVKQADPGRILVTHVSDGAIRSIVEGAGETLPIQRFRKPRTPRKRGGHPSDDAPQMDLFDPEK